jgi:Ca-activated chloride channel family protein
VASWRPLGDPESLPQAESGAINAAMMYEVSPRSEVAADPSARYGAVRYWADRSGSTAIGDAGGRTNDAPLIAADMIVPIDNTPADARFAAALAGFGGLLRGDPAMRDLSCTDVIQLAKTAAEPDPDGARAEFISLMERAEPLIDLPPRETGPAAAGSADDSAH